MLHEHTTLLDFAAQVYPRILHQDLLRYVVGAGGTFLVINVLLAGYLAGRKIRAERPGRGQMAWEILASLRTVLIFSLVGFCIALAVQQGLLNVYMDPAARGWPYFAVNVVVLIVAHDAWFYWTHRLTGRGFTVGFTGCITARTTRLPGPRIPSTRAKRSSTPSICRWH